MTEQFTGTEAEYLSMLEADYFAVCKDQTVLEIGPLNGYHSKLIVKNTPEHFEVIEPHKGEASRDLQSIAGIDKIIVDDALLFLSVPRPYSVVVCFGVLYHLHSPIHLLELIASHCRPKYVLLDSVGEFDAGMPDSAVFHDEAVNQPGTRQVSTDFKFSGLKIMCPGSVIQVAMNRLGYELVKSCNLNVTDHFSKSNSWMALWKIKE